MATQPGQPPTHRHHLPPATTWSSMLDYDISRKVPVKSNQPRPHYMVIPVNYSLTFYISEQCYDKKKVAVSPEATRNSVSYRSHSSLNSNHSPSNTQDPPNNGVSIRFPLLSEPYRPVTFPLLCPLAQMTVPTSWQVPNTTSP